MAQRPSFDVSKLSTASKVLLGAGALLFIDMFLPWYKACAFTVCGSASGWNGGFGVLLGLLVLALLAWEGLRVAGVSIPVGTTSPSLISAILAGAVALFAILHFLLKPSGIGSIGVSWGIGAFIGLILGIVVGYGGYLAWQASKAGGTVPPAPSPGPAPGPGEGYTP
jgi:hypothetical protein